MLTRRSAILASLGLAGASLTVGNALSAYEPVVNDDGLLTQPWFLNSFLELADDQAEASAEGKHFAVMWEQKGCPYCKETHMVNFARPEINDFVREHFNVLQLNIWGSREVVDFDGAAMEERELARRWGVRFTPTTVFFDLDPESSAGMSGKEAEVARMPGYLKPPHFLAMFQFVQSRTYQTEDFRSFLKRRSATQ